MPEPLILSHLDRALLHALDVDGRASFARLGDVLGVSAHTAARRYQRLRAAGIMVVCTVEPQHVGRTGWLLRIRTVPDAAGAVAKALARRDDTAWISLVSAGTEIVCGVHTSNDSHRDELLLGKLPHTPQVVSISAHYVLHEFTTPETSKAWLHTLSEGQIAALRPDHANDYHRPVELTATDQVMLDILARDGRATHTELADATGSSESAIRRRIGQLRAVGALTFAPSIDPSQLGYDVSAHLWLTVEPSELARVGQAIANHPGVPYTSATTGSTNLTATVTSTNPGSLYRFLTEHIGPLHGVRQIETSPIVRTVKRFQNNAGSSDRDR